MIYIFVFILLLLLSYYYDYQRKIKNKALWYNFVLILFILIAGLRYRIGVDTMRYEQAFENFPPINELSLNDFLYTTLQPLYIILCSFARFISDDFWVMQLIHSLIVNLVFFRFCRLNTRNVFLSLLFYFIFLYSGYLFEAMRESFAVCMLLLGWEYLKKDRWLIFTLFVFLATLFHISAVVLFILPLLKCTRVWNFLKINNFTVVYFVCLFFVGIWLQDVLFDYIAQLNTIEGITEKADSYADTDYTRGQLNLFGIIETCIRQIFFPFWACIILKKQKSLEINVERMVFICLSLAVLSLSFPLFYRYKDYFYMFAILTMSNVFFTSKIYIIKKKYIVLKSFFLWLACLLVIVCLQTRTYCANISNTGLKEYMKYYPYSSIIFEKKDKNRENLFRYYNVN